MVPDNIHPTSGSDIRLQCRAKLWDTPTTGIAPGYLQANLIVLPSRYAADFANLCARNPVPCPLLASSKASGDYANLTSHLPGISSNKIASGIDIRNDAPRYNVYIDGELHEHGLKDVTSYWDERDHVAFLIGCSYSFENALTAAGLPPPQILQGRNVPMYRTKIPLCPAGVFRSSTYVVSMRMYRASEVERVRDVTRPYRTTHGEPIAWGWEGMRDIGIVDVNRPEWGDAPVTLDGKEVMQSEEELREDGNVPVFWGCGVTPQEAVMTAQIPGGVIGHTPGHMIVLDVREEDVIKKEKVS